MDLTGQTQIQIQNKVFTLGSPVTHVDTLNQLLYAFEQQGVEGRPIVIINPVDDCLPNLDKLLENYIENAMQGVLTQPRTTYMFQDASDEDIIEWAHSQYHCEGYQSIDSLIETGKAIREQSRLKRDLDTAKARREELWKQHCLNPESNEGSDEYANITYNVIPEIEKAIQKVTKQMESIPRNLNNGCAQEVPQSNSIPEDESDNIETVVENLVDTVDVNLEMVGSGKPDITLSRSMNLVMPLSIAKQQVSSPQNSAYKKQQEMSVPGYTTVPLEYLLALGIRLYADGVPIVYTKTGRFRRIGSSSISPIVNSYWYPTPRYY